MDEVRVVKRDENIEKFTALFAVLNNLSTSRSFVAK